MASMNTKTKCCEAPDVQYVGDDQSSPLICNSCEKWSYDEGVSWGKQKRAYAARAARR